MNSNWELPCNPRAEGRESWEGDQRTVLFLSRKRVQGWISASWGHASHQHYDTHIKMQVPWPSLNPVNSAPPALEPQDLHLSRSPGHSRLWGLPPAPAGVEPTVLSWKFPLLSFLPSFLPAPPGRGLGSSGVSATN